MNRADKKTSKLGQIQRYVYHLPDRRIFDRSKRLLRSNEEANPKVWEDLLQAIGTEESYQRCCDGYHEHENILYVLYEMVKCAYKGEQFLDFGVWEDAIGMEIDGCYACAEAAPALTPMPDGRCYFQDRIVMTGGNRAIVIEGNPNIYLCSCERALNQEKRKNRESILSECVGATVVEIRFEHREIQKGTTGYRQPVFYIRFDTGTTLRFSTNFGEVEKEQTQNYFEICSP